MKTKTTWGMEIEKALANTISPEEHKARILGAFAGIARYHGSAARAIHEAMQDGILRREIIGWLVKAGYDEAYVRRMVSECFVRAGKRENAKGQGRPSDPRGVALYAKVQAEYGEDAVKVLSSALNAARKAAQSKSEAKAA